MKQPAMKVHGGFATAMGQLDSTHGTQGEGQCQSGKPSSHVVTSALCLGTLKILLLCNSLNPPVIGFPSPVPMPSGILPPDIPWLIGSFLHHLKNLPTTIAVIGRFGLHMVDSVSFKFTIFHINIFVSTNINLFEQPNTCSTFNYPLTIVVHQRF